MNQYSLSRILFMLVIFLNMAKFSFSQELRDVKSPIAYPSSMGLFWALLLIIISISLCVLIILFFWRKRNNLKKGQQEIILPWQKAFALLNNLEKDNLLSQGRVKEYFLRLSDILRHYCEEELDVNAPDMTTEEFLVSLRTHSKMTNSQKNILKEFLACCDMVKFAKHNPSIEDSQKSMEIVKKLINETKKEVEKPEIA